MKIASASNPRVKFWRRLGRSAAARREEGALWIEGAKFVAAALEKGLPLKALIGMEGNPPDELVRRFRIDGGLVFEASEKAMHHCSTTDSPPSLAGVFGIPSPASQGLPEKGLWVVLCGLQDPGNVGAVVRCVHAAGWSGVLVDSCADPFSPKGIRASAGSVFHVDVRHASLVTLRDWKGRGAWLAGADVHGAGADMRPMAGKNPAALVLGAEGAGLSEEAASLCDAMVKVPLASGCESLNVAAACAVLLYSWGRFNLDAEVSR